MPNFFQNNVVSLDKRSASGHSADLRTSNGAQVRFLLAVSAVSGTAPTLDVRIEGKTLTGNYVLITDFTQVTGVSGQTVYVVALPSTYRVIWTVGGTAASFTFEVEAMYSTGL